MLDFFRVACPFPASLYSLGTAYAAIFPNLWCPTSPSPPSPFHPPPPPLDMRALLLCPTGGLTEMLLVCDGQEQWYQRFGVVMNFCHLCSKQKCAQPTDISGISKIVCLCVTHLINMLLSCSSLETKWKESLTETQFKKKKCCVMIFFFFLAAWG